MDIDYIKDKMLENEDCIIDLLEKYQFHNIRKLTNEVRCSHDVDSNATSVRVKLVEGLPSTDFSKGIKGDIFTLIMKARNTSLYEVIQTVKFLLGLGEEVEVKKKSSLFGGVYDNIRKRKQNERVPVKTYSLQTLKDYENGFSYKFLKDGISLKSQKYFGVGYDIHTDRITVPWYSFSGELIGIMGRYNGKLSETHAKWFPVIAFSKSNTLYGFYHNYQSIVQNDTIYIGESEKFVMQLHTMGYGNCVALGGNAICDTQIKQLLSTQPKTIVFALDEGLDTNIAIANCLKVKQLGEKLGVNVGYIIDKQGKYLKPNEKQSPSDLGKTVFESLVEECIVYV